MRRLTAFAGYALTLALALALALAGAPARAQTPAPTPAQSKAAPAPASKQVGMERLEKFLDRTRSMRAKFRQEIVNDAQEVVETAEGTMALQRPGRFRWDYEKPYERAVVADGERLWLYEADLQQVTVRSLAAGLGETPAALLTGDRNMLARFEFVSAWSGEQMQWVRLKPRAADSDFESVSIGFAGERPVRLEIEDRLGQLTRLALSDIEMNVTLAADAFTFRVPEGVDVIREGPDGAR